MLATLILWRGSTMSNRKRVQSTPVGNSLTKQSFKNDSNINNIVNRFLKTGSTGLASTPRKPVFGDFTSVDFMEMRNQIADVDQAFASLPARVRSRFAGDPYQVIRFLDDPNNKAEAVFLGLLPQPEPPARNPDKEALKTAQEDFTLSQEEEETDDEKPLKPKKGKTAKSD